MAATRRGGGGRPRGPKVGSILTGMILSQAKRGVLVELGSAEVLLPRAKYGAAADRIEAAGYGDALTVEVVADPSTPGGLGLTRVGIERSLRQPRSIAGRLERDGSGFTVTPTNGSDGFRAVVLDHASPDLFVATPRAWLVGAPYRDHRFVLVDRAATTDQADLA